MSQHEEIPDSDDDAAVIATIEAMAEDMDESSDDIKLIQCLKKTVEDLLPFPLDNGTRFDQFEGMPACVRSERYQTLIAMLRRINRIANNDLEDADVRPADFFTETYE